MSEPKKEKSFGLPEATFLGGFVLFVVGIALWSIPAASTIAGVFLMAAAYLSVR